MSDLPGLPPVTKAAGQPLGQAEPLVGGLQEDRTAVGAAVPLVELRDDRLAEKTGEQNRLSCGSVLHAKASVVAERCVATAFLPQGGFCFVRSS